MANSFQTIELASAVVGAQSISRAEGGSFSIAPGDSLATVLASGQAAYGSTLVGVSGSSAARVYLFAFNDTVGAMTTAAPGLTIGPTFFDAPSSLDVPEFSHGFEVSGVLDAPTAPRFFDSASSFNSATALDTLDFGHSFETIAEVEPPFHLRAFDSPPLTDALEFTHTFNSGEREPLIVTSGTGNTGNDGGGTSYPRPTIGWQFPLGE